MMIMKWIMKRFVLPTPTPLGRWSQCGEKKVVSDVLDFKVRQKARRQHLVETGTDPFVASVHPPLREVPVETEEYMRPFVVQS